MEDVLIQQPYLKRFSLEFCDLAITCQDTPSAKPKRKMQLLAPFIERLKKAREAYQKRRQMKHEAKRDQQIAAVQGLVRGKQVRNALEPVRSEHNYENSVICFQAHCRGTIAKRSFETAIYDRRTDQKRQESVLLLQAFFRATLQRLYLRELEQAKEETAPEVASEVSEAQDEKELSPIKVLCEAKEEKVVIELVPSVEEPREEKQATSPKVMEENKPASPIQEENLKRVKKGKKVRTQSPKVPNPELKSLKNKINMFEQKVENINKGLTPGVNNLAPPPEFGPTKKLDIKKQASPKQKKKKNYKFSVKVTSMKQDSKNKDILTKAVKGDIVNDKAFSRSDALNEVKSDQ
jgi:hypothetical protein